MYIFGHKNTSDTIRPMLKEILLKLILNGTDTFYVGNQGNFDRIVLEELRFFRDVYPNIRYYVVLAYLSHSLDPDITIYPEGLEKVPKVYAISYRNKWMIKHSDTVVVHTVIAGNSRKFADVARCQGKTVIEIP